MKGIPCLPNWSLQSAAPWKVQPTWCSTHLKLMACKAVRTLFDGGICTGSCELPGGILIVVVRLGRLGGWRGGL